MRAKKFAMLTAAAALAVFPSLLFARPPRLAFSTYLGGENGDYANAVAVDDQGRVYVAGSTNSPDFPIENPYQYTFAGRAAFISVFSPYGRLLTSTYFGGNGEDRAYGIALHQLSPDEVEIWLTGFTRSSNFPRKEALQEGSSVPGQPDAFVSGFLFQAESGSLDLKLSTYLGGEGMDVGNGIAVDGNGDVYVVGLTKSPDFPFDWIPPGQTGVQIGFVTKFSCGRDPYSWDWGYSLCLTGSGDDQAMDEARAVAVDDTGSAWVVGETNAPIFFGNDNPSDPDPNNPGSLRHSAFIARIAAEPDQHAWLLHSKLLGGSQGDFAQAIALRPGILAGSIQAVVVGRTASDDFPVYELGGDIFQPDYKGGVDAFVSIIDFTDPLYRLEYSTYLGGSGRDSAEGVALDSGGNIYVTGYTGSPDFPVHDPIQGSLAGEGQFDYDVFVSRLNRSGNRLLWATYLGGGKADRGKAIAVDPARAAIVAGYTNSDDFPVANSFQPGRVGEGELFDAFVARISPPFTEWYLPAGAANIPDVTFDTYILVANPNNQTAPVRVEFFGREGLTADDVVEMAPLSRRTFRIGDYVLPMDPSSDSISTVVTSLNGHKIFCERAMYFPGGGPDGWKGGNNTIGISGPATEWHLPEGATHLFNQRVSVFNPGPSEIDIHMFLMAGDDEPGKHIFKLGPRRSIPLDTAKLPIAGNGWDDRPEVSVRVTSNNPVAVDRTMFWPKEEPEFWRGSHSSRGITEPSTIWYLAEGANHLFDHYVLVSNPGDEPADVHFTFMDQSGFTAQTTRQLAPQRRQTVHVNSIPGWENRDQVSTVVESKNGVPVFVERAMYWPRGNPEDWTGGHNTIGAPAPAERWHLPEGATHHFDMYVLVANPDEAQWATATFTFMDAAGNTHPEVRQVGPKSRQTVHVNSIPGWEDKDQVSTVVESPYIPVLVERAMYFPRGGPAVWRDGHVTIGIAE